MGRSKPGSAGFQPVASGILPDGGKAAVIGVPQPNPHEPEDDELALFTVVHHTTSLSGNRWELPIRKAFLKEGAFHLQQINTVSKKLASSAVWARSTRRNGGSFKTGFGSDSADSFSLKVSISAWGVSHVLLHLAQHHDPFRHYVTGHCRHDFELPKAPDHRELLR